jgi:Asp-tRNA(Asn)/Glu-tRNA(Gln) amidotransferase A subunit family amidase
MTERTSALEAATRTPASTGDEAAPAPSVADLVLGLRARRLQPVDVLSDCLARVAQRADLNAFLWSDRNRLLAAARGASVEGMPLAGLPIAVKDNIDTAGIPTTSGSPVDRERVPRKDAEVWRRLRDERGALLLGKTHMSEFGYRSHNPTLGWPRNPRRLDRATGGSSSGSAAAVAAGIAPAALGTDTGGSIRIPAAYCGIVGIKGTVGLVETEGLVPLSTTMDHLGVLARSVTDAAIVFEEMPRSRLRLVDPGTLTVVGIEPGELRVGLERGWFLGGSQPAVVRAWSRAAARLESAGCRMVEGRLPAGRRWRAAHRVILRREAWQYHADRVRAGAPYGPVFLDAMHDGAAIADSVYQRALAMRQGAIEELSELFRSVDVLLTPTCPTVAPPMDEGRRTLAYTRYTTLASFAGVPAVSIPAGTGSMGLPVGVQLMAAPGAEATVVRAAALLESLIGADRDTPA